MARATVFNSFFENFHLRQGQDSYVSRGSLSARIQTAKNAKRKDRFLLNDVAFVCERYEVFCTILYARHSEREFCFCPNSSST